MPITLTDVSFTYQENTPFEHQALDHVSLEIKDGTYTAIVGQTGSGKSTLLQHINGLLVPTSGKLVVNGVEITPTTKQSKLAAIRKQVGFVFQFPEAQLFEETVLKDIAFGPQNYGVSREEATAIARHQARVVGLPESVLARSPFELSGGQMRRVAIAGILALKPKVLILDEPTAGLDPGGRRAMMDLFEDLHAQGMTIILVTHQMNDVAEYADDAIVLEEGKLIKHASPRELFADPDWLLNHNLNLPQTTAFATQLVKRGFHFDRLPLTEEELAQAVLPQLPDLKGGA